MTTTLSDITPEAALAAVVIPRAPRRLPLRAARTAVLVGALGATAWMWRDQARATDRYHATRQQLTVSQATIGAAQATAATAIAHLAEVQGSANALEARARKAEQLLADRTTLLADLGSRDTARVRACAAAINVVNDYWKGVAYLIQEGFDPIDPTPDVMAAINNCVATAPK